MSDTMSVPEQNKLLPKDVERSFPQTPEKSVVTIADCEDNHQIDNQDAPNTVRRRRGFRPLSVLTNSVFLPFDTETLRAMDNLENKTEIQANLTVRVTASEVSDQDYNPSSDSKHLHCTERSSIATSNSGQELPPATKLYHEQVRHPDTRSIVSVTSGNESEISLGEFLRTSSPEKPYVKADYASLFQLPPPDPSQHPIHQSSPFNSHSDGPSLITNSTASEIRKFVNNVRKSQSSSFATRASSSSEIFGSAEKRRFPLFDSIRTPDSSRKKAPKSPMEISSPLSQRYRPIEVPYLPISTPSSIGFDENEKKRSGSGGLRKFSDMIKARISIDKVSTTGTTPSPSESLYDLSPTLTRNDLEEYLRKITYSPSYPSHEHSWYPRHPNTARNWKSRNLKCTTCLEAGCGCCGRACCAYKAAVLALENHKHNLQGRNDAVERIQQITMVYPYGKEAPTFLQCTIGENTGCGKMVCPDCCGICPDPVCQDTQCRRCKRDPWAECDWHADLGGRSSVASESVRQQTSKSKEAQLIKDHCQASLGGGKIKRDIE